MIPLNDSDAGEPVLAETGLLPVDRSRADFEVPDSSSAGLSTEVERLKQLLSEQQQETLNALLQASQLRREMTAKRTELTPQPLSPQPLAEIFKLQVLVQEVQTALEQERKSYQASSNESSQKIALLEKTLDQKDRRIEAVSREASAQIRGPVRTWPGLKTAVAFLVLIGVAAGVCLTARTNLFVAEAMKVWDTRAPEPNAPEPTPATRSTVIPPGTSPSQWVNKGNSADFSAALSRLDNELSSFPGSSAQEVLRQVNETKTATGAPVCDFEWTNGEPAVRFRGDPNGPTITASVNTCASALERFRAKAETDVRKEQEKQAQNTQ